ncbi:MAG: hypothetical protein JXB32_12840 [Deltaproteobacteria bacterium]|nr:hypothetical protein [Deltaproteobacteria bacterium]
MTYGRTLALVSSLLLFAVACGDGGSTPDDAGAEDALREDVAEVLPDVAPDAPELDDGTDVTDVPPPDVPPEALDDGGSDDAPPPCEFGTVNALRLADDAVLPLYRVGDGTGPVRATAFAWDGTTLEALDQDERPLWTATPGAGALAGGMDFDGDGRPDLVLAQSTPTGEVCGSTPTVDTRLTAVRGATGEVLADIVAPLRDLCWTFGATTYPTSQWTIGTVLFGASTQTVALSPYYATTSWFATWSGSGFSTEAFHYPSSAAFDATYTADLPNPWGTGTSYLANSHVANGLIAEVGGVPRLVFFTSGRVVHYALTPPGAGQLLRDVPFLTGGRTDLAGRNYGLVALDPQDPDLLVLLAGASSYTVYDDLVSAAMVSDPWGQIERHVTVHRLSTGALDDRFYSYAHDASDGHQYEGRVVYPAGPFVRTGTGGPSRLAYNVYAGGHWWLHVSQPGATADAQVLRGRFLWDVRDLDGDGHDEWVVSPVELPGDPDVPGWYFPRWRTDVLRWDEATGTLEPLAVHDGAIPQLVASFRRPNRTASQGYLYPVLTVSDPASCAPQLVLRSADGMLRFEPVF